MAAAVKASKTTLTDIYGVGPYVACHGQRRGRRRHPLRQPSSLRGLQRHRAHRGVLGAAQDPPAVAAWQPPSEPRHPHGRRHPGPPPPKSGTGLLRSQTSRGQDRQRGVASSQAPHERRHPRRPACRRTPRQNCCADGPGRANGERLCLQRGRLTPRCTSSSDKPPPAPHQH
jgi:hypothetical protein